MRVYVEPAMRDWRLAALKAGQNKKDTLGSVLRDAGRDAECESTSRGESDLQPVIATGHQAWLWHPGILAKYMAARHAADRWGATVVNVVVDQDLSEALRLDLPVVDGRRVSVHVLQLAQQDTTIPTGSHIPVDSRKVIQNLLDARDSLSGRLPVDLTPLLDAWRELPTCRSLAQQLAVVLSRLMQPYVGEIPVVFASELLQTGPGRRLVERMLSDPKACVQAYNQAVDQAPDAGVAKLKVEQHRVELPLWWMPPPVPPPEVPPEDPPPELSEEESPRWIGPRPRQRVFADLTTPGKTVLVLETGQKIDLQADQEGLAGRLTPRALLLTGLMRSRFCDLFVHGKGGRVYDRVTEKWWKYWLGEELAPAVTVSADVYLDFKVPVADRRQLQRAAWWVHHLPHNLDRFASIAGGNQSGGALVAHKRALLEHMNDDRDPKRRAAAFTQIHHINHQLAGQYPQMLDDARHQLRRAQQGITNHAVAMKRDWCFALYEQPQLKMLWQQLCRDHEVAQPAST